MSETTRKAHWDRVWSEKDETDTSWFQERPGLSLELIEAAGTRPGDAVIDVGGGASRLVDHLLDRGFGDLTVLDLSAAALAQARHRLGGRAHRVHWLERDATGFRAARRYRLWHDRAVFHFLLEADDRARYRAAMERAVAADGQVIIATFGPDGPMRCSGLPTVRYGAAELEAELGPAWSLLEQRAEIHRTPARREQHFVFCRFGRRPVPGGESR